MLTTQIDKFTDIILDSITDGVFTVDQEWRITSFNKAAEEITGILREEAIGARCSDVFRASLCESGCVLRETMRTGRPVMGRALYIVNADGDKVTLSVSTALLKDKDGEVIGGVETFRDLRAVEALRKTLTQQYSFSDIISKDASMQKLFAILPRIAQSDSTVLVQGESGTGKELFARVIHQLSPRHKRKMVAVNCSALPDTLLESELFGYKAGAFTDAKKDKKGRFAQAEGGTLFLDEIADLAPALQAKLLRVLQEREYEPLGATESVKANVRIVAATNKDLATLVAEKAFRQDLFYRLNVIKLFVPPLRQRKQDIPLLVRHFISTFNHVQGKHIHDVSPHVMRILMRHNYPGNIRELENIIEHAFVLCNTVIIQPEHLPSELIESSPTETSNHSNLQQIEADYIYNTLEKNNWNRAKAAADLGIHKSTLFRKIKKFNIQLPPVDGRSSGDSVLQS
ncbi:PAS domain-containing protein [candidate division KSB1 bacterium]|nr:sigma 54-interacting transcriptional regulator [candidate division KSB1 bacterium]RQW06133.1 MAG: PAS domain-containing protein [candidate division KSB1 bacterium]